MTHEIRATEVGEEFPRWLFRKSGINRCWAIRQDRPTTAQIKAGCKLFLSGDDWDQLLDRIRTEEDLLAEVWR
ncbi:hypothetical protein ACFWYW_58155 [Nonomuraea sp. NPDC059023]|uniref:hypothetical protein n=1 Tax=unclassified Nonomuraea TaxID=2593643 RepID=UPI003681AB9F